MTTTNVYQGMGSEKNTSRVLQAPGGSSSGIFGHYQEDSDREQQERRRQQAEAVAASAAQGSADGHPDVGTSYLNNKDSFAANRLRNHGEGAPFATNSSLVSSTAADRPTHQQQVIGADYETPQQRQAANRNRNLGGGAPFAVGDYEPPMEQRRAPAPVPQQRMGEEYLTPQQRQANNPNKAVNSFNNLFGNSDADNSSNAKAKGKISTHNPVTWEAYSNFDADKDQPQHRSRFENFATTKAGTFNPITGQEHTEGGNTIVKMPPGGKSSIQF